MVLIAMRTIVVQSAQYSRMAVRTAIPLGFPGRLNDGRAIVLALRSAFRVRQGTVIGPAKDGTAPSAARLERQPIDRTPQLREPPVGDWRSPISGLTARLAGSSIGTKRTMVILRSDCT